MIAMVTVKEKGIFIPVISYMPIDTRKHIHGPDSPVYGLINLKQSMMSDLTDKYNVAQLGRITGVSANKKR